MSRNAVRGTRLLAGLHILSGAGLTAQPHAATQRAAGSGSAAPVWVVRALGGRLLVQGLLEAGAPRRRVLRAAALADAAHGSSMLAAAAAWPRYRRPALISAATALGSAAVSVLLSRSLDATTCP